MTGEPEDEMAAAAICHRLRASHTDRERVIEVLKAAFTQGPVTKDEFDARVGQTFASRTYAELAAVTADLPAGLIGDRPLDKAARPVRPPMSHSNKARRCVVIAVALMTVAIFVHSGPAAGLFAPLCFTAWTVAGAQTLASRHEKRSRGQLPSAAGT